MTVASDMHILTGSCTPYALRDVETHNMLDEMFTCSASA